jgi:FixJ family two-component response regulator
MECLCRHIPGMMRQAMNQYNPTVFVVDDEPAARNSVAALVSSMSMDCRSFSSAEQFLDGFNLSQPGCIVIDLNIDDKMNGLELQERLKGYGHVLPVVLLSAYLDVPITVRAMQNGAFTVLEKPCQTDRLADVIRNAVEISRGSLQARMKQSDLQKRYDSLDSREREVMMLILSGLPNKTIARELGLSQRTAARIRAGVFEKMGAESALDLAQMSTDRRCTQLVG